MKFLRCSRQSVGLHGTVTGEERLVPLLAFAAADKPHGASGVLVITGHFAIAIEYEKAVEALAQPVWASSPGTCAVCSPVSAQKFPCPRSPLKWEYPRPHFRLRVRQEDMLHRRRFHATVSLIPPWRILPACMVMSPFCSKYLGKMTSLGARFAKPVADAVKLSCWAPARP